MCACMNVCDCLTCICETLKHSMSIIIHVVLITAYIVTSTQIERGIQLTDPKLTIREEELAQDVFRPFPLPVGLHQGL